MSTERQYSINLQGVLAQTIFVKYLYEDLINQICCSPRLLSQIKVFLLTSGVITQIEQQSLSTPEEVLNCLTGKIPCRRRTADLISKFLCHLYGKLLPPAVAQALEDKIKVGLKDKLGPSDYIEGPVFERVSILNIDDTATPCLNQTTRPQSESFDPLLGKNQREENLQVQQRPPLQICARIIMASLSAVLIVWLFFIAVSKSHRSGAINSTDSLIPTEVAIPFILSSESELPAENTYPHFNNNTPTIEDAIVNRTTPKMRTIGRNLTAAITNSTIIPSPPYNFSNIFENPEGFVSLITDLDSVRYSQARICQDVGHTTLNISLTRKVDIMKFNPNCSEKVKGLDIAGPVSTTELIVLMQKFFNVEFLSFSGHRICEEMEDNSSEFIVQAQISMDRLSHLKFENLTECPEMYKYFAYSVETPNLKKLVLANIFVNSVNQELIENIVTKNTQIESLYLKGSLCDQCQPFKNFSTWPRLKHLEIDVVNPSGPKAIEFYKIALKSTSDLLYLKSNIELNEKNINFFRRSSLTLVYVDVAVKFNDSRLKFSIKSFKDFPDLRQLHFKLRFSNQSLCIIQNQTVRLNHLKELVEQLPNLDEISFTSNCKIAPSGRDWRLPCRGYEYGWNESLQMRSIKIIRQKKCTSNEG